MSDKDEPAFPTLNSTGESWETGGLTKREYAAIQIMAGFAANVGNPTLERAAQEAVRAADALLAELEKFNE